MKTAQLTTTIDVQFSVEEFIPYRQGKVKL